MKKIVDGELVDMTADEIKEYGDRNAEWESSKVARESMIKIIELENSVTPRRLRDALITVEGKVWLENIEEEIQTLRNNI